jgi:hypothetical protein
MLHNNRQNEEPLEKTLKKQSAYKKRRVGLHSISLRKKQCWVHLKREDRGFQ